MKTKKYKTLEEAFKAGRSLGVQVGYQDGYEKGKSEALALAARAKVVWPSDEEIKKEAKDWGYEPPNKDGWESSQLKLMDKITRTSFFAGCEWFRDNLRITAPTALADARDEVASGASVTWDMVEKILPSDEQIVQMYQKSAIECCNQCEITAHEETRVVAVKHACKYIRDEMKRRCEGTPSGRDD